MPATVCMASSTRRTAIAGALLVLSMIAVAGCKDVPQPTPPSPEPTTASPTPSPTLRPGGSGVPDFYAITEPGKFTVMKAATTVAEVTLSGTSDYTSGTATAWSADGRFVALADGAQLHSVDLMTGDTQSIDCQCNRVAFAGDVLYTYVGYESTNLLTYDPKTLKAGATFQPKVNVRHARRLRDQQFVEGPQLGRRRQAECDRPSLDL